VHYAIGVARGPDRQLFRPACVRERSCHSHGRESVPSRGWIAFADQLREAARNFYGTPIREFLPRIVKELESITAAVKESVKEHERTFLSKYPANVHPQVSRAAQRFALAAAAGELATALGITGWEAGVATTAVQTCFDAYLGRRGHLGAGEIEAGVEQVRRFIILHGASRFAEEDGEKDEQGLMVLNRAGFKIGSAYCVYREIFRDEITAGHDWRIVEQALAERGLLRKDSRGKLTCVAKNPLSGRAIRVYWLNPEITGDPVAGDEDED